MFGKPHINAISLETLTLEVPFIIISVYVFTGLHCLLAETVTRVEVFCKKSCYYKFRKFL